MVSLCGGARARYGGITTMEASRADRRKRNGLERRTRRGGASGRGLCAFGATAARTSVLVVRSKRSPSISATNRRAKWCVPAARRYGICRRMAADRDSVSKHDAAAVLALLVATLLYALVVVRDFSGPLVGEDDTNALEHLGYVVEHRLSFDVLPHLDFSRTKEFLYPFGTVLVFLPWGLERDLLYALGHHFVGEGPWIQLYQTLSVAISALGTYALLRREEGPLRAALVAFAGTFMNFYAVYKYPHHQNCLTAHWTVLTIVTDFVLFRQLVRRQRWSLGLVLFRLALVPLVFGLDLGYVAGFALLSGAVTWIVGAGVAIQRRALPFPLLRAPARRVAPLVLLLCFGAWLYLPLTYDIVRATKQFHFEGPGGAFWANQARLFFPWFPLVGPQSNLVQRIFGSAEGVGEMSSGWALLAVACFGLRAARRDRELLVYVPILVAFALAFSYYPRGFPTLRIFPWFQFNRVAGRVTLVMPIWFALVGLAWRPPRLPRWLAIVGALETVTAHAYFPYRPFVPDASFWKYMKTIAQSPGEAVLDWPLCISGGNGVATKDLCPYYAITSTTYAYRRFHGKDVVGLLLSRMTPEQAAPFYAVGLPQLFFPDSPEIRTARRQTRCFDAREMDVLERFYRAHDFAGMSLYPDILGDACMPAFYERFGRPTAETRLPAEGRAQFVPRAPPAPP